MTFDKKEKENDRIHFIINKKVDKDIVYTLDRLFSRWADDVSNEFIFYFHFCFKKKIVRFVLF